MRTPALYALLLFSGGILLATNSALPAIAYLGTVVIGAALAVISCLIERIIVSRIFICVAVLAAGAFVAELQSAEFPSNHVSRFAAAGEIMTVTGVIVSEPDIRPNKTYLTVEIDSLQYGNRAIDACGKLRLQIQSPTAVFGYRDRIRFTGYVNEPLAGRNPGAFDYRRYLAIRQISATVTLSDAAKVTILQSGATEPFVRAIVTPVRSYISETFERFLPLDRAAVMKGFLIGDVRYIPREVYQRFKDTGTLHVLAASGANVGYVIATLLLGIRLFRLPRDYRNVLLIAGVVVFSFLAYNQPSVVRAAVMAIVALLGLSLHRDINWLNTISIAALVILLFRPLYLYDLGFQLSFGAAFSLILFMPVCERWLPQPKGFARKTARYFLMILYGSIIAQLGVTPILIYNFHSVPLVSFLANLLIVPLVGVVTTLGIILVFVSAIPVLSTLIAQVLSMTLGLTLSSIDFFHTLPIPQLRLGAPHLLAIIGYYLTLQLLFAVVARRRVAAVMAVLLAVCLNVLVWKDVAAEGRNDTCITFLDTHNMTTVFVQRSNGKTALINAGGTSKSLNLGEVTVLPFLMAKGVGFLDSVFATTTRSDNLSSLVSTMAAVQQSIPSLQNDSLYLRSMEQKVQSVDSSLLLSYQSAKLLLLAGSTPVQDLNNLPPRIDLVAADWRYLKQVGFADWLSSFGVGTLILTTYPSLHSDRRPLADLRQRLPNTKILSVLESGGITVRIDSHGGIVLATANN